MEEIISSANHYKDELFKQLARIGKCLSSDKRLEILNVLTQGPKSVEKLAKDTGMNVANVSRHLQILNDAKLVKYVKEGTYAIYSLADSSVVDFMYALWNIGENRLSDITRIEEEFFSDMEDVYTLTKDEVYQKLRDGNIVLMDIRPEEEYEAEHIEGAVSVPIDKLDVYLQHLPRDKEAVAYCRGKYCVFSAIATQKMKNAGYKAYHMADSVYEWKKYLELKH